MTYRPKPIKTTRKRLPERLTGLVERLAENAHDLWARERIAEGWRCGAKKDPARKRTPLLVPYADLPESEKRIDRAMVTGTIRAMLALGYDVRKMQVPSRLRRKKTGSRSARRP